MRLFLALLGLAAAAAICFDSGVIDATGTRLDFQLRHLARAPTSPFYPGCSCDVAVDGGGMLYGIFTLRVCGKIANWLVQPFGALGTYCTWTQPAADVLRFDCHCRLPIPQVCSPAEYAGWLAVELNASAPCYLYGACSTGRCG